MSYTQATSSLAKDSHTISEASFHILHIAIDELSCMRTLDAGVSWSIVPGVVYILWTTAHMMCNSC